jgi:hypothetical protein
VIELHYHSTSQDAHTVELDMRQPDTILLFCHDTLCDKLVFMLCVPATVEQMTVIETIADDTLVFLQVHKRIWPTTQRDSLFWSHMRQVPDRNDRDGHDIWIVCNHSTENPDFPVSSVSQSVLLLACNVNNLSYFRHRCMSCREYRTWTSQCYPESEHYTIYVC